MTVTTKVKLDLQQTCPVSIVSAVQNDRYTRSLEIHLFADGASWPIPADADVLLSYGKPDGTGGEYDTLPDGTKAWWVSDNILTVVLAPQMLTVSGAVTATVTLVQGAKQISAFPLVVNVSPRAGQEESADYYAIARFLPSPQSAKQGQYLRIAAVDGSGRVTRTEAVDAPSGGSGGSDGLTEEDKQEIVREVLAAIPAAEGVGF